MCEECNITFIGPSFENIENMGNKAKAREMMINANVPIVPGSDGIVEDSKSALEIARKNWLSCYDKSISRRWWKRNKDCKG